MFDFFNKKTKIYITCTITITLVIGFLTIFFSYSLLQVKEYLIRAENTSKQNSKYIELCMTHYENNLSFFIENKSDTFKSINHIDLYDLFKEYTINNNNISNVFYYNDSSLFNYNTLSYEVESYISTIRGNKNYPLSPQWSLLNNCLLYSYPIIIDDNFYGCFVISILPDTLISYSKNPNNSVAVLQSPNGNKTLIGDARFFNPTTLPSFSASEYSHTGFLRHINNFPIPEKGISIINIIPLSKSYKSIAILGVCLTFILIISILLAYYFISKYNSSLIKRLEHLSSDISKIPHDLSKGEMQSETLEQY